MPILHARDLSLATAANELCSSLTTHHVYRHSPTSFTMPKSKQKRTTARPATKGPRRSERASTRASTRSTVATPRYNPTPQRPPNLLKGTPSSFHSFCGSCSPPSPLLPALLMNHPSPSRPPLPPHRSPLPPLLRHPSCHRQVHCTQLSYCMSPPLFFWFCFLNIYTYSSRR